MTIVARNAVPTGASNPDTTPAGGNGLIIVDHTGCIRFSNSVADALIGQGCLDDRRCVLDLFSSPSRAEVQRLLDGALSGLPSAPLRMDVSLIADAAVTLRLQAFPLLGKTSGRPVAVALEIGGTRSCAGQGVFSRAELLTDAGDFRRLLERAFEHYQAIGVEYVLCCVRLPADSSHAPGAVQLDRLLMSLRAGDTVAATGVDHLWALLGGCGAEQVQGIRAKLEGVFGCRVARDSCPRVEVVPLTDGFSSVEEWCSMALSAAQEQNDTMTAATRVQQSARTASAPAGRARRRHARWH